MRFDLQICLTGVSTLIAVSISAAGIDDDWVSRGGPMSEIRDISSVEAVALSLNRLTQGAEGVQISNPAHRVELDSHSVRFIPRQGPVWTWTLESVTLGDEPVSGVDLDAPAVRSEPLRVVFNRGSMIEQYLAHGSTVEQRFVLPQPLKSTPDATPSAAEPDSDLVIVGAVECAGQFQTTARGWRWIDDRGAVRLGEVLAFDADGKTSAGSTRIVLGAESLASATFPVTIDPEIGANDFRISEMGGTGDTSFAGANPDGAYSPLQNNYFVVWEGDDNTDGLVEGELHIFGQFIDAATGDRIGDRVLMSLDHADPRFDGVDPQVAYSGTDDRYMVVWRQDTDVGSFVDGEYEIWARAISATGIFGLLPHNISDAGGVGNSDFLALAPAIAYNETDNEYLVVWYGEDNVGDLIDGEYEIFGQRIDAFGFEVGTNDFRISDMGGTGSNLHSAGFPQVAYNGFDNEYLVVWHGEDDVGGLINGEYEIFGQRLNAATGTAQGVNDFRISDAGGVGDAAFDAFEPAIAYNEIDNQYLVVWYGDDTVGGLIEEEFEIFGQLLDHLGGEVGANDFRISDLGGLGGMNYLARSPRVTFNDSSGEYFVVWFGDDNVGGLQLSELEIFAQRLDRTGSEIGDNDFRLSDAGGTGENPFDALYPVVAWGSEVNQYLIAWYGTDDVGGLIEGEFEIFGQLWAAPEIFADGFESGDAVSWSSDTP
ncbi:MAG: hypothetical protein P8Y44_03310 [Acidobacteriota bacterium]